MATREKALRSIRNSNIGVNPYGDGFGIILHGFKPALAALTAVAKSPDRPHGGADAVAVHILDPRPYTRREPVNTPDIASENSSREAVTSVICKPECFSLVFEPRDREHRAEQFRLHDEVGVIITCNDGWRVIPSA